MIEIYTYKTIKDKKYRGFFNIKRLLLLSVLILLLGACSNTSAGSQDKLIESDEILETTVDNDPEQTSDETEEVEVEISEEQSNETNNDTNETDTSHFKDVIKGLEEFLTLTDIIDLTDNEVTVVEDNPGKRVLIISNEK